MVIWYDGIDFSEGIDINKTSDSHECRVCHCWCFFKINFSYQPLVCNNCHDLLQKSMSFDDNGIAAFEMIIKFFIET